MQTKVQSIQASITSRVVALLLTAFPLAAVGLTTEQETRLALDDLRTYEEFRAYIAHDVFDNYWAWLGLVACAGFAYVAMVEGVAFLLRTVFCRDR